MILPRMLDKGRAELAGTSGEYHYNCPLDEHFLKFAGVDAASLKERLATGLGDGEILQWITANAAHKRSELEISQWSDYHDVRGPSSVEQREWFQALHKELGGNREDISSWADLLDLDDFVSFGGKA